MFHILVKKRHDEDESSVDDRHVEKVEKVELASLDRDLVFLVTVRSRLEPNRGPLDYWQRRGFVAGSDLGPDHSIDHCIS